MNSIKNDFYKGFYNFPVLQIYRKYTAEKHYRHKNVILQLMYNIYISIDNSDNNCL